jgi:hypothetical protein
MKSQWKIINQDKLLTENEVHALVLAVEKYLDRPGSEPVREVVTDYNAFIGYVQNGAAKGIFPDMWPQYLQSAKSGFLRFRAYRDTLPQITPAPAVAMRPAIAKPAPRPAFPNCCKVEWERVRRLLKVSAVVDVVAITDDVHAFGTGAGKGKRGLRDPEAVASAMGLANTTLGSLFPEAARQADQHAALHDDEDEYLQAWWTKLAKTLRKFVK